VNRLRAAARAARGGLFLVLACAASKPLAQAAGGDATLPEVEVRGDRDRVPPPEFDARASTTVRSAETLARAQPGSIFEALRDVPGVSVNGGPRPSGMNFNIRGFSDNEDVLIKLDGVPKGFEKYRFGGTFVEPELLKAIEVQRGPQIQSGSGALGGTISATTKDAADLLDAGERWGLRVKQSRATNNNEDLRSFTAYARPTGNTDILVNTLRRESGDIRLSDGARLPLSTANTRSRLLKGSVVLGDLLVSLSLVDLADVGLQPYDATGGQPGFFGSVVRDVNDQTRALTFDYAPPARPWIQLKAVIGEARTRLIDTQQPGQTPFANAITGVVTETYDYHNRTIDIANTARIGGLPFGLEIKAGLQAVDSERVVTRFRQRIPSSGFDASIPPGIKRYVAAWLQPRAAFGPLEVIPGVRIDRYSIVATGGTEALLASFREPTRLDFERTTASLGVALAVLPQRLSVFYNVAQAFRPPLTDEVFTQGVFSRCANFLLGAQAPRSQICGSLYRPQESLNQELGASWSQPVAALSGRADAKLTVFEIDTRHLLRSLQAVSPTAIGQPGKESRHGVEFEASLRTPRGYLRGSYARIRGVVDTMLGSNGRSGPSNPQPLFDAPGDTLSLSAGLSFGRQFEVGVGYQNIADRSTIIGTVANRNIIGIQPGVQLWSLNARWTPSRHVEVRVSGENLGNEKYNLANGFGGGLGFEAPGINLRLAMVLRI
jgi:hemoglobin/transferrin/lactoferrin receptor protein